MNSLRLLRARAVALLLFCWLGLIAGLGAGSASAQSYSWTTIAGVRPQTGGNDGNGANARFNFPTGVVSDGSGNVYVCDSANHTVRKITSTGDVTTIAGVSGVSGSANGLLSAARFNFPAGLAFGPDGLYVADRLNHLIRRIGFDGTVSTFAGTAGVAGATDGPAATARFNEPWGLAFDPAANLYVVERGNATVRKITPAGVVSTLAGTAGQTGSTDGTGAAARFNLPTGMTPVADAAGNFYIADAGNGTIRKLTPAGVVTTFAGTAGAFGTANGTGAAARFSAPNGLVTDGGGNVYVADSGNDNIRAITPAGVVATLVGTTIDSRGYLNGPAAAARFFGPFGVAISADGFLYIADSYNQSIRRVSSTLVVTTIAGPGSNSGTTDGPAESARLNAPGGLSFDNAGNLFIADTRNSTVRRLTSTGVVSTVAGLAGVSAPDDGFGGSGRLGQPTGIAVLDTGTFVTDPLYDTLRGLNSGAILTVAGTPAQAGSTDATGLAARFNAPWGVAVDRDGNIYIADSGNHTIRRVGAGSVVTTVAGAAGSPGTADGAAGRFNTPRGLALDRDGNLYVADSGNHAIRKVSPGGVVSTIAGQPGTSGTADGAGSAARFNSPAGIAVAADGTLFIADTGNQTIRKITPAGVVTTIGGASDGPTRGAGYADGSAAVARFSTPTAIVVDAAGVLYVAEAGNHVIVRGDLDTRPTIIGPPPTLAVAAGSNPILTVFATGGGLSYQWKINNVAIPGATDAGYLLPNVQASAAGSYTVDVSNSASNGPIPSAPTTLTVVTTTNVGRIINLSILSAIATAGDTFTMGYVVGGTGTSGNKPLVIRAAGPSLGAFGVPDTLDDPNLDTFAGSTRTGGNDDWGGSASLSADLAAVGAFPFASPTSKDSAVSTSITSRDNSVVVSAASKAANSTGTVLAEIYDGTPGPSSTPTTPRLLNVSVRKNLGTGLTAGFVLGGATATKVLIRAVGPGLAAFGVGGTVPNPQLTLFNAASVKIGENNDWGGSPSLSAAFGSVGAFTLPSAASKDAAILVSLPPGNYSVLATGTDATGVALVEVYEVP